MQSAFRVAILFSFLLIGVSCVTDKTYNRAVLDVMSSWKALNEKTLEGLGTRFFRATKKQGFLAAQLATRQIGMIVEKESYETGFLLATSTAPTPLTMDEWKVVQDADTRAVRAILGKHSVIMGWFYTLEPASKDLLANVFVTEKDEGIEVSIGIRLRSTKKTSDKIARLEAPPTAVPIGLRKFWAVFEKELIAAIGDESSPRSEPISSRGEPTFLPAKPVSSATEPVSPPKYLSSAGRVRSDSSAVAVIIGNKNYGHNVPPVSYAHNDADAMRDYIFSNLGVNKENIIDLRDASLDDMEGVFGNDRTHKGTLWRWVRPGESNVYLFYSGHGVPGLKDGRKYLLPVDADSDSAEIMGYPIELLYRNLGQLQASSVTAFLDTCFSGAGPLVSASGTRVAPKETPLHPFTVVTATQSDQVASWDENAELSLFTKHLLDALRGAADSPRYGSKDGKITLGEIKEYLDREMTYAARRQYGREQHASISGNPEKVIATINK